ncbi:unnamed protein product [Urochloa humidicola]
MLHCLDSSIIQERSLNSHAPRQMILLKYSLHCDLLRQPMARMMVLSNNNFVPRQSDPAIALLIVWDDAEIANFNLFMFYVACSSYVFEGIYIRYFLALCHF